MKKLKMETKDLIQENIEKLAEIFPGVITEERDEKGNPIKAVDFELLKQELSDRVVEGDRERYQLTWPGKKEAMFLANMPINKTLRPVKEESVDWENTGNIYIEGDNLEALKILQESYLNKIKCIYIDPPYNTGKDFIYKDNFKQSRIEYLAESGQVDGDGNRLFQNTESNGRFHSDWLSMMYPRLKLARNLLREDGVIFISIDDNEVHNLRKICDEVFGERNFVATIIWQRAFSPVNLKRTFSENHDFIICYSKNKDIIEIKGLKRTDEAESRYSNPDNDPRGPWTSTDLSVGPVVAEKVYPITTPSGKVIYPPNGRCWVLTKERFEEFLSDNRIWFGRDGNNAPRLKKFKSEVKERITPMTLWLRDEVGDSQEATRELKKIFDEKTYIDYPKPVRLLKRLLELTTENNDIILDFFSGSATTAHAVMQLNAEDEGNRKYIMVQLPEPCPEDSEAYKAGFKNISEIGKERIRRAAKKIKEETGADIDYGFRVFKVDSSNMKDVYYRPEELSQQDLFGMVSNIKEDRTGEDLLIQVMLEWGLELSLSMEKRDILGKEVHFVAGNSLVACFDEGVSEELVREIAREKPLRVVFRDSSFADDAARINVEELFKMLSPTTEIRVI
ncbi:adenine specific DNA methylase Mod [Pelotomaculum thermopropionicum SI]|uniref:Adenine specific DNA methylase Mod n=1 Tax=Pelotomaculum thermopropionicum (strain DSM 13744 / JCM 10971 / SI) TaxID=370438 RepID=A5D603_PELTS|nr:adenine specific DNA methylase Mod [Pelotomaculum thermopropionicum SI]